MRYYSLRHFTCSLNGLSFQVTAKYTLPLEENGDATLVSADCEVGKGEFRGMSCPILRDTRECPFRDTIPDLLPAPY